MLFTLPLLAFAALARGGIMPGTSRSNAKDVTAISAWPESNPRVEVRNGAIDNLLFVKIINNEAEQITLTYLRGQYYSLDDKDASPTNTTVMRMQQPVMPLAKSPRLGYRFHSENVVGPRGLRVFVDYMDAGNKPHTIQVHEGPVTVIEPKKSWFDLPLLLLYAVLSVSFYYLLKTFAGKYIVLPSTASVPKSKISTGSATSKVKGVKSAKKGKAEPRAAVEEHEIVVAEEKEDEWLPNIKPKKAGKK